MPREAPVTSLYGQISLELPEAEKKEHPSSPPPGLGVTADSHPTDLKCVWGRCQQYQRCRRREQHWLASPVTSLELPLGKMISVLLIWCADNAHSHPLHILCVGWPSEVPGQHIPLYAYTVGYVAADGQPIVADFAADLQVIRNKVRRNRVSCGFTADLLPYSSYWGKSAVTSHKIHNQNWHAADLEFRTAGQFLCRKSSPRGHEICKILSTWLIL